MRRNPEALRRADGGSEAVAARKPEKMKRALRWKGAA